MKSTDINPVTGPVAAGVFPTTHWSLVLSAADENSPRAADALARTFLLVALKRFLISERDRLRAEVAKTVDNPIEIDAELRHLLEVLSPGPIAARPTCNPIG